MDVSFSSCSTMQFLCIHGVSIYFDGALYGCCGVPPGQKGTLSCGSPRVQHVDVYSIPKQYVT